jgi:hypothetical protein
MIKLYLCNSHAISMPMVMLSGVAFVAADLRLRHFQQPLRKVFLIQTGTLTKQSELRMYGTECLTLNQYVI